MSGANQISGMPSDDVWNRLEPGERIVYKARVRWAAYVYPLLLLGGVINPDSLRMLFSSHSICEEDSAGS